MGVIILNSLQKYFNYRKSLIDQYVKGDMSKREYLDKNLDAVLALNIKPFKNVDNIDKGLFNYQYYNAMAKEAKITSRVCSDYEIYKMYNEKSNYYYSQKDKATMRVLQLMDFQGIRAYFIKVKSQELKNKLFEIILDNKSNMILHSSNEVILKRLKEEGVFESTVKTSVIDSYINQRY